MCVLCFLGLGDAGVGLLGRGAGEMLVRWWSGN
jgi:hypothetical protein